MARQINAAALAILKGAESCRLHAYPDPGTGGAPWTCGWGATGKDIGPHTVWTQQQADARLQQDMAQTADRVEYGLGTVPTTDNQFGAMCSLCYNIGIGNFMKSSVLRFHLEGETHEAAAAFAAWDKGGGKVLPGLIKRRAAESALYLTR